MTGRDSDVARRFVTMIDEFYDRAVKVLMTAEAPIDQLYTGQRLAFEFQRTVSRLMEMQSRDYLDEPHRGGDAAPGGNPGEEGAAGAEAPR